MLQAQLPSNELRNAWLLMAKYQAIMGSCPKSMNSLKSGIRTYLDFVEEYGFEACAWPPTLDVLLAWSCTFKYLILSVVWLKYLVRCGCRCMKTFTNYLNYVRAACLSVGLPNQVFEQKEALRRAKVSIFKKGDHVERPKMWVRLEALTSMACKLITMPELYCCFAMFLTTYAFHLRFA